METLFCFGNDVKALDDNGKVGGYAIVYSNAEERDLDGEYFTSDTYLGPHNGDGADVLFQHGIPVKKGLEGLSRHIFSAPVKTKKDDIGIFAETVLNQHDAYEKAVLKLVKAGKIKWSTGSVDRVVRKEKDGKITRWPVIEISMTHTPAQPFGTKVAAIKSLVDAEIDFAEIDEDEPAIKAIDGQKAPAGLVAILNQYIDDRIDDGHTKEQIIQQMARGAGVEIKAVEEILAGQNPRVADPHLKAFARALDVNYDVLKASAAQEHAQSIKGIFEQTLENEGFSSWRLWDILSNVICKIANVAKNSTAMGVKFDRESKLDEAYKEFFARHKKLVTAQIDDFIEAPADERFYIKAITDPVLDVDATKSIDLDDHAQLAVSALTGVIARFRGNHEMRKAEKAGRMLSEKNRKRVMALIEMLKSAIADLQKLLDESAPMASDSEKRAAESKFLRLKWRAKQRGTQNYA
jgi:phage head maturation protease